MRPLAAPILAAALLVPASARASVFGEENAALAEIAATVGAQLSEVMDYAKKFNEYYRDFKEYAGYAKSAYDTFQAAQAGNLNVISAEELFDSAFPDAARIRKDMQDGTFWQIEGDDALKRMARHCLTEIINGKSTGTRCAEFEGQVTATETRNKLHATFGTPTWADTKALTDSSAEAMALAQSSRARATADHQIIAKSLREICRDGTDPTACQLAANEAGISSLDELATVNEQLAKSNELMATLAASEAARLERERAAEQTQQRLVLDAAKTAPKSVTVDFGEGVDLGGGRSR